MSSRCEAAEGHVRSIRDAECTDLSGNQHRLVNSPARPLVNSPARPPVNSPARPPANLSAHGLTAPLHQAGGEDLLPLPQRRHPAASP